MSLSNNTVNHFMYFCKMDVSQSVLQPDAMSALQIIPDLIWAGPISALLIKRMKFFKKLTVSSLITD